MDDERALRIQKYKEERRKQLTARTATLFSSNVTERRRRPDRTQSEEVGLKSSSEANFNSSPSVSIRTTRTSRLRAAANQADTPTKNTLRSSSVQNLLDNDRTKPSKTIERDKRARRQSSKKENVDLKSPTTNRFSDTGATKFKHSINLDKKLDSPKTDEKKTIGIESRIDKGIVKNKFTSPKTNDNERIYIIENISNKEEKEEINGSLDDKNIPVLKLEASEVIVDNSAQINEFSHKIIPENVDNSVVPNEGGLLDVVCVRKVERFSELLSNLCSPSQVDVLFDDLLAENGIEDGNERISECSQPCKRAQPTPRSSGSGVPKRTAAQPTTSNDLTGAAAKTKPRRPHEASSPKTETTLPSSRASPKNSINLPFGLKSPSSIKGPERRKSSENGTKPSLIPLSKKTAEKHIHTSTSPIKHDSSIKVDTPRSRVQSPRIKTQRVSPDKSKSDSETRNDRRHRTQRECERYQNLSKRLTSLKNSSPEEDNKSKSVSPIEEKTVELLDNENMSILHESALRPHTSRLSQEVDSVAEFAKRTLDRVNKLTNNIANKSNLENCKSNLDTLLASTSGQKIDHSYNYGLTDEKPTYRGVTERLNDIDMAAQRLIDFEKQSAMFSDLSNDSSSQNVRLEAPSSSSSHTPISILKRKSINEENMVHSSPCHVVPSPPVTFSPNVVDPNNRSDKRQGILKKRRSLDESQVARRRSCSPEVSFAESESPDPNRSILKNRRSSLEDIVRNRSPDGQIHGILKRKMSKEDVLNDDLSHGSPEPHGILKRKSNSSSASSTTTSSHVSIAQAVLLAAAGGAEIVEEDKDTVRPILKKKSFSEERPCLEVLTADNPKPILKKKNIEDEYDTDLPKRPILKTSKRLSGDEGPSSSFEMSEEDRSSRRPSLLRSRTSDHSSSECEATVKPILKQRGSSLTRERSQSPRPRLSFCTDNGANVSAANFSCDLNELSAAGPRRVLGTNPGDSSESFHPSVVLRRRNLRPKSSHRSKSLAGGDVNNELLSILNNRRLKVDKNCENGRCLQIEPLKFSTEEEHANEFPSVASKIKNMEEALSSTQLESPKPKSRDRDRYKTQPITVDEIRSITSCLEPGQAGLEAFGSAGCSFPSGFAEAGSSARPFAGEPERDPFAEYKTLESPIYVNSVSKEEPRAREDSFGEATFLDFESLTAGRKHSTLDEIEQAVNKVRVALDEDCRALDEDDRQAEADNWSLNVSCDSGVYNRASSRDSGPHSGEELGLIESQEIKDNHATNSSNNEWSSSSIERGFITMDRKRKSTEVEARSSDHSDDEGSAGSGFALGLVKSNSVVARASMWQQLQQQQAKGQSKPPLRHNRSKVKDASLLAERFKTQPISFISSDYEEKPQKQFSLAQSKSSANVLDRDEDAKLDEDDPAKMSIFEKMKLFNTKLTHKPPVAGLPRPKEERSSRTNRLKTMPVLSSQVQEAMEQNERLSKSMTHEEVPRNPDFKLKMELFRSASAKNTSLEFLMKQDPKFRSLDMDDESPPNDRIIAPEVRGILKTSTTVLPKPKTLVKGESSEGLKDEGIDSSSDESASASSESSLEKSCSSSDSSENISGPKQRRFQRKNHKLKSSRTDSDLTRMQDPYPLKIIPGANVQLPGAIELKQRFGQNERQPLLGKLGKRPSVNKKDDNEELNIFRRPVKKLDEPIQLAKLRRSIDKTSTPLPIEKQPVLKISAMNQEAKNKFFGITPPVPPPPKELTAQEELVERVRKYIPQPVSKSISTHTMELITPGSGSDGESSGGREVRRINTRGRHRLGGGVQRSATHAEMPHRGGTIAERLAALQAAGANDWRARVCRLSPEKEDDSKAIERVKNKINESLNATVDEKKKVQIDENELGTNILADRRTKLETASQGWRKRVPQTDATQFTVAGRLERDKVTNGTPPATPPPTAIAAPVGLPLPTTPSSPGIPQANKFRSRRQQTSPTKNGFASGPLRSASCAVVSAATAEPKAVETAICKTPKIDRDAFKRSHSVSESISRLDEKDESPGAEKAGCPVRVPRADDETFQAFYTPALPQENKVSEGIDVDLDAIDVSSRQLLSSDWARRAKRERRHVASRNPLKALAARTDLREEYSPPPSTAIKEQLIKERATANVGLAAEALAALASKEDFSNVSLRNTAATPTPIPANGLKQLMLLHVKGRRRVQTRLVEPVHTSVNRGDSFVLITPHQVFLYIGFYANVIEKNRSTDIALHIHNTKDLGCKNSTSVIQIDEQTKNYSKNNWNQFWTLLGVKDGVEDYKPVETGLAEEDEIYESCIVQTNMCYEVQDDELVPIKEYWGQQPKISMLHQSKTIVFDFGSEMYIWYGKNVPLESRRRAAQLAQELFDEGYNYQDCHVNPINAASNQGARTEIIATEKSSKQRPEWAVLSKITQHMETILFKEKFLDWPDYTRVIKVKPQENKINTSEINPCDAEEMWSNEYQEPDLVLEGSHLGRGTHYYDKETMRNFDIKTKSLAKWVIREFDFQKVENEAEVPEFFAGDSYIIRWEYQITVSGRELNGKPSKHNLTGRDRCAYFCWQGKDASSNEKGAAALLTVELDREKGPQVRVAQGSEPTAFLNLFQGSLIIHQGKKDNDKSRYKLFVTRGNVSNEAYLLQVPCSVRQLRSRGSLLLVDTEKGCLYIWHGSRSLKHTKNIAIDLANKLIARKSNYLFGGKNMKITEVKEGEESKEVLEALGVANKQYYNSVLGGGRELEVDVNVTPRLFHFSDLGGQFEAHEVLSPLRHQTLVTPFPFEQKELYTASQPALFLLDDGVSVWIWQGWWPRGEDGELEPAERSAGVGAFASRWQSLRAAALRTAEAYWRVSRKTRPDIRVVTAGLEPRAFTELFDCWTEDDNAAEANIAHGYKAGEVLSGACELSRLTSCDAILPLAALQRRPLPDHVDPHHLERHLSSPDFLEAFGMTKEEFSVLPAWKQTNLKKDVGLF